MDVVYFHNLKQKVADLAIGLGFVGCKTLPRQMFPKLLHQALNRILPQTVAKSFSDAGIFPLNKRIVDNIIFMDEQPAAADNPSSESPIPTPAENDHPAENDRPAEDDRPAENDRLAEIQN